jgi:hypothetical protein
LVKIQIVRRWAVVATGVALLCGLPVIASALRAAVHGRTRLLAAAWANFSTKDIIA